jgi:carbon storage regulator CsrA
MLVLSRKPGEKVVLAGTIHIVVLDVHRGRVRLGIVAPTAVRVTRGDRPSVGASPPRVRR